VTYDDLDVNTKQGRDEVKQRIERAADLACKEIEREYPLAQPDHLRCASKAASDAMEQFRTRLASR
jgi:UrcA family protein